ncbi:MAG: DUF5947 family protein [Labedaea sp.]
MTARGGLRRFVGPPVAPEPSTVAQPTQPAQSAVERCELCATPVDSGHGHVVDVEQRSIMCACRACYLLFTREEAGGGRFRAVPDRYLRDLERPISPADWDGLGVPVGSAFFLRTEHGLAAFYPSPAGATECLLDLDAWSGLAGTHPLLAEAAPEVEAILVRRTADAVDYFLVPVDECYELVGLVRMYWTGFDGGPDAAGHIDEFFAGLAGRARAWKPEG